MKTVNDLINWASDQLTQAKINDARLDARILLAHAMEIDPSRLPLTTPTKAHIGRYRRFIEKRANRLPVAYITHKSEFYSKSFYVSPAVLIPRPETELIVENISPRINKGMTLVDCGTGSGILAISLYRPDITMIATDISKSALRVARKNAKTHNTPVRFLWGDLLKPLYKPRWRGKIDGIVSNLPYIPTPDLKTLDPELKYEPDVALTPGKNGLRLIHQLIRQTETLLRPGGFLALEIGYQQSAALRELLQPRFSNIQTLRDIQGIERLVIAQ